jgi:hypothetical protein
MFKKHNRKIADIYVLIFVSLAGNGTTLPQAFLVRLIEYNYPTSLPVLFRT